MGYFDSPKNKAMWEKEITRLEMERERREHSDVSSAGKEIEESRGANEKVREITLAELEKIVREERGMSPREPGAETKKRAAHVNEREGYEREISRQPQIKSIV